MARELAGLKVKILLKPNGHALYPDFNSLQCVKSTGMDWCNYIDIYGDGAGWHYDATSGHRDETEDSPRGQQWGVLVVSAEFVDQAIIAFPKVCSKLLEADIEKFYNEKAHVNDPSENINTPIIESIKLKQDLGLPLTKDQLDALNPLDPTLGITINKHKVWSDHKETLGITIKEI